MTEPAVLFDLDGTLLDSLRDIADAMNAVLSGLGFPAHPVDAYRGFVGAGVELLVGRALPREHRDATAVKEAVKAMKREYAKRWDATTRPYEGVPELLDCLTEEETPTGVVSNKPEDFTRMAVTTLLPKWIFGAVLGARQGKPKKPHPDPLLEAASILGVHPSSCLFVGDCGSDMEAATSAGMVPVGALWGFRDEEELRRGGARHLLEAPHDLLGLLPIEG